MTCGQWCTHTGSIESLSAASLLLQAVVCHILMSRKACVLVTRLMPWLGTVGRYTSIQVYRLGNMQCMGVT
jgi:hypothetical protein